VEEKDYEHSNPKDAEAKSLLEELNGLNMQLLERVEAMEDTIGKLTVERDQARSKVHLFQVENESVSSQVQAKDVELDTLKDEIQRMHREREAWREIQAERDALLEEKHRWAMSNEFAIHEDEDEGKEDLENYSRSVSDLDNETKQRLEQELGQAEALILRFRAELGGVFYTEITLFKYTFDNLSIFFPLFVVSWL
jgi:chromosome segregation ATPase